MIPFWKYEIDRKNPPSPPEYTFEINRENPHFLKMSAQACIKKNRLR
jgi:hypothetical protein